ncbi:Cytochrome P450 family protein [Metarhizium album ARSEF 1941]|uniref:Cytochrome P450 family protein n=1 Tax=Metarhizium album (strain ARSEF 1941) TaxID=1081103 RepID=A0A0B2X9V2_METAS|nr:Cytochrome P450 family protein [Metarhizium album ARSEF 1941]KHO02101.1 Cytochrome P450 family protein [Metarhizium album ARSEF 1941]
MDSHNFRAMLAVNFEDYDKQTVRIRPILRLIGHGIFTKDGPAWKHSRDTLKPLFLRAELSDVDRFKKHVDRMLSLIPRDGSTVDLKPLVCKLFLDSGTEFVFGKSFDSLDENAAQGDELMEAFSQALIGTTKRRHAFVELGSLFNDTVDENIDKIHAFVDRQVSRALAAGAQSNTADGKKSSGQSRWHYVLLDELAKHVRDPVTLRYEMMNIFLPAFESTAVVLSNTLFHLARNSDLWAELRKQAVALGDQELSFELLRSLSLFRYTVLEALRLHGSSGRISRTAIRDTVLPRGGGPQGRSPVFVSKGTVVSLDFYAHLHDAEIWGHDANEFRPSRFEGKAPKWEFVPFSGGPRICPAQQQVMTQSIYLLVRLAQEFAVMENRDLCVEFVERVKIFTESARGVKVALHETRPISSCM